jgi:ABC-2 type transport system ATP-binding protein
MSGAASKRSACELLERFEITEYANMTADKLSKGNQQKVQLAATMIHDPELIILDEPFSGLDPVNAESLRRIINGLVDEKKYIIMSSHQMETVENYCENLILLHRGHALVSGNLRQIKESYGVTRLAVSANADIMPFAMSSGLTLLRKNADCTEFAIPNHSAGLLFLKSLTENSIVPTRFEMLEPSLNEIFIDKVGEGPNAGGAM